MLLKLAGIGKLFGARAVLRNISFEVHPGTVTHEEHILSVLLQVQ